MNDSSLALNMHALKIICSYCNCNTLQTCAHRSYGQNIVLSRVWLRYTSHVWLSWVRVYGWVDFACTAESDSACMAESNFACTAESLTISYPSLRCSFWCCYSLLLSFADILLLSFADILEFGKPWGLNKKETEFSQKSTMSDWTIQPSTYNWLVVWTPLKNMNVSWDD